MLSCAFLGRSTLDLIYLVRGFPQEDTKVFTEDFVQQAGGPALNAAVAFAQLGGAATLYSAIGETTVSKAIHHELNKHNVSVHDVAGGSYVPPIATALVNAENGKRTVWNPPLSEPPASSTPSFQLRQPMALIDGFLFDVFRDVLKTFTGKGGILCLDGGSWKPQTPEILGMTSIAICSERFVPPGTRTIDSAIDLLHAQGVRQVAFTRGGASILASDDGRCFEIEIEPADAVDTLGAGDILHGTFCWYYLQSSDFRSSLKKAAHAATLSCRALGARQWIDELPH